MSASAVWQTYYTKLYSANIFATGRKMFAYFAESFCGKNNLSKFAKHFGELISYAYLIKKYIHRKNSYNIFIIYILS